MGKQPMHLFGREPSGHGEELMQRRCFGTIPGLIKEEQRGALTHIMQRISEEEISNRN